MPFVGVGTHVVGCGLKRNQGEKTYIYIYILIYFGGVPSKRTITHLGPLSTKRHAHFMSLEASPLRPLAYHLFRQDEKDPLLLESLQLLVALFRTLPKNKMELSGGTSPEIWAA